jgi:hypothetical protein
MTNQTDSILHPMMDGLFVLSGLQGGGKTTLAMTVEHPDLSAVLDFDLKGQKKAKGYGIERYYAPNFMTPDQDPLTYEPQKIVDWTMKVLKEIGGITNLVIDNATALEAGLGYLVEKNPAYYGLNAKNVAAGRYGGPNPGVTLLWLNLYNWLRVRGIKVVFFINHMTQPWSETGPIPNRFHVKGNKIFRQLSSGTLIITPGDIKRGGKPPKPAALVIKESLSIDRWNEDLKRPETIRTVPMRFPIAEWPNISYYFDHPADFQNPAEGETWSKFELDAFGEFLSSEQLDWIKSAATIKYSEDGPAASTEVSPKPEVKELTPKQELWKALVPMHYKDGNEIKAAMVELNLELKTRDQLESIQERLIRHKQTQTKVGQIPAEPSLEEVLGEQ